MPNAPKGSSEGRSRDAAVSADNRRDCDKVIRIQSVAQSECEAKAEYCKRDIHCGVKSIRQVEKREARGAGLWKLEEVELANDPSIEQWNAQAGNRPEVL